MARSSGGAGRAPVLYLLEQEFDKRGNGIWHDLWYAGPEKDFDPLDSEGPLAATWKPMPVYVHREKRAGDFFPLESIHFAATERAVSALRPLLGDRLEALPLQVVSEKSGRGGPKSKSKPATPVDLPPVFALHTLQYVDLTEGAEVERFANGRLMTVERYAFRKRELVGRHFFKARDYEEYLVSEEFRQLIEGAQLRGLAFRELDYEAQE
jgi:hypothetical protein